MLLPVCAHRDTDRVTEERGYWGALGKKYNTTCWYLRLVLPESPHMTAREADVGDGSRAGRQVLEPTFVPKETS